MKRVVIIGGGVAGFCAGIYLRASGYDTLIIEKNAVAGGACIGWERSGCYIDGCIHWMAGVSPKSSLYHIWRDTHAIMEDTEIFYQDELMRMDYSNGKSFTLWRDLDKLEKELVAFAPEDEKESRRLVKMIRRFQHIDPPSNKPVELMNLKDLLKIAFTMAGDYYWVKKTSKISCEDYAKRFKNKYLRDAIEDFMAPHYNLMSMLYMLGHISAGDGGIPVGGSLDVVRRMEKRYVELGGKIRKGAPVSQIIVENDTAKGIILKKGEEIRADWVVSTTPVEHCTMDLLGDKYREKDIDLRLENMEDYPIYTYTVAVFKCPASVADKALSIKLRLDEPITIDVPYSHVAFRNYGYDETLKADDGSCVIQATIHGDDKMYFWWKEAKEKGTYKQEKQRIAKEMLAAARAVYPDVVDQMEIIDVITSCTYERYLNSRHGAFQGFVHTDKGKSLMQNGRIKGLKNFILAGQYIIQSGGLPPAGMSGRFAAQRICHTDKTKFCTPEN